MKKTGYITICIFLCAALTACHRDAGTVSCRRRTDARAQPFRND